MVFLTYCWMTSAILMFMLIWTKITTKLAQYQDSILQPTGEFVYQWKHWGWYTRSCNRMVVVVVVVVVVLVVVEGEKVNLPEGQENVTPLPPTRFPCPRASIKWSLPKYNSCGSFHHKMCWGKVCYQDMKILNSWAQHSSMNMFLNICHI